MFDPITAPGKLAGRGLRVASRLVDFSLNSAYLPAAPSHKLGESVSRIKTEDRPVSP